MAKEKKSYILYCIEFEHCYTYIHSMKKVSVCVIQEVSLEEHFLGWVGDGDGLMLAIVT